MKSSPSMHRCALLCVLLFTATTPLAATYNGQEIVKGTWQGQEVEYIEGEILIGLQPGKAGTDFNKETGSIGVEAVRQPDRSGFMKVRTTSKNQFLETIEQIAALPSVRYAEPNIIDYEYSVPNDSLFDLQWHYHNTGQIPPGGTDDADIDAPEAWDIGTGSKSILVGILDSGIPIQNGQLSHPDLDDTSRFFFGYDFVHDDIKPADDNGHGTHVTGTVAAEGNNGVGVIGVAPNTSILSIKVFNYVGYGTHEGFRDGCIFAVDHGCRLINYSGGGSPSATKEYGVAYADSNQVLLVAAAGNSSGGPCAWPARYSTDYSNVVCVSATDHNDQSAQYSSNGSQVNVCAPGGYGNPKDEDDVFSTMPNYDVYRTVAWGLPKDYGPMTGTSTAAPHVTGLAALILGRNPLLTPDSVRQIMMNTADDLGPQGFDNKYGWGRINAASALASVSSIGIAHTPLENTNDPFNDIEVVCRIHAQAALEEDSLKLKYSVNSIWHQEPLISTGAVDEYHAFIPAQPAGAELSYYLVAFDTDGNGDSTEVYNFMVISYDFEMWPQSLSASGTVGDSLWYPFWVRNDGGLADSYDISVVDIEWATTIFDATGLIALSTTPPVDPGDSMQLQVLVEIPASSPLESDTATVLVESVGDPSLTSSLQLYSVSNGPTIGYPISEFFTTSTLNPDLWLTNTTAVISDSGLYELTEPYSLNLDGAPTGGDTVVSRVFDLSGAPVLRIVFYYQRSGGGGWPEYNKDLVLEVVDSVGNWITLETIPGGGPHMWWWDRVEAILPASAYHIHFQFRFATSGYFTATDDYFVDNIYLNEPDDYSVAITPKDNEQYAIAGDTASTRLWVHNYGRLSDQYLVSVNSYPWEGEVWDSSGTFQIDSTDIVEPGDSVSIMVKIVVPPGTPRGVVETSDCTAASLGDVNELVTEPLLTISAGDPISLRFVEQFTEQPNPDTTNWLFNYGAQVTSDVINPPSPPNALKLDGMQDTIISVPIDLSGLDQASFTYYYQRTGAGESPDEGDDLWVDYLNDDDTWRNLDHHLGSGPDMTQFEAVQLWLPPDAMHRSFQFRIRSGGDDIAYDDWYVDDLVIDFVSTIAVDPAEIDVALEWNDTANVDITIVNLGAGLLTYDIRIVPLFGSSTLFGRLFNSGRVNPPYYDLPEETRPPTPTKGIAVSEPGPEVLYNAGGPDAFGYTWVDTDEPGGPSFDWVDIESTGVEITGLGDDNVVGPFMIGFSFPYYGKYYSWFLVSGNGMIGFGPDIALESHDNVMIPSGRDPDNMLAWCWTDLNILDPTNPGGRVFYQGDGNRLVIQFVDYPAYNASPGAVINAQVILRKNGEMLFQYKDIGAGFDREDCTIGIERHRGSDGLMVAYNTEYLHDSLSIVFTKAAGWISLEDPVGVLGPGVSDTLTAQLVSTSFDIGWYHASVLVSSNDPESANNPWVVPVQFRVDFGEWQCGDINFGYDGFNILDLIYLLDYMFTGGPEPVVMASADLDGSGAVDIADVVYYVDWWINGGPEPVCSK